MLFSRPTPLAPFPEKEEAAIASVELVAPLTLGEGLGRGQRELAVYCRLFTDN